MEQRFHSGMATTLVLGDQTGAATSDIDAPIVFVGYGIDAPEYKWDDYKGVDVKGKVLLVIVNEPPSTDDAFFKGKALTYYGRWTYKYEEAARRGAVGVLIIHRTDLASYGWEVVRNSQAIEKSFLQNDPLSTLKAAETGFNFWIARGSCWSSVGIDVDKAIDAAGKPGFQAIELPMEPSRHTSRRSKRIPQVRFYECNRDGSGSIEPNQAGDSSTPRITTILESTTMLRETRSTMAPRTTRPAAAFCWRWLAPLQSRRSSLRTQSILPP